MAGNLHFLVTPILVLALFCGLHPLFSNVKHPENRHKWIRISTCYWLFVWILSLQVFLWTAYYTILADIGAATSVMAIKLLIQLGPPFLIIPTFLYISINCARSFQTITEVERVLPPISNNIHHRVYLTAKLIIVGQLAHHLLLDISSIVAKRSCIRSSLMSAIHLHYYTKYCLLFYNACFPSAVRIMVALAYQMIIDLQWVCGPLLIITVSRTLEYRLDALNSTLEHYRDQTMPKKYWQRLRERYNNIARLTRIANNLLHPAILVCCLTKTVLIILFIYTTFNYQWGELMHTAASSALVYHCYVNVQLLMSMSAVSELSRRPLTVLTSVPTVVYNEEVSRFYDQVVYDHLALSGGNIFDISRTFIVNVVSFLITYEVLLLQEHVLSVQDFTQANNNGSVNHNKNYCVSSLIPVYNMLLKTNSELECYNLM